MLTLYFVRHGETDWNVENRVQGRCDSKLTNKGMKDIIDLRSLIKHISWQAVYSSPSERTLHTVALLTNNMKNVKRDNRIKEMSLGLFEGMTWEEIKQHDIEQYTNYWYAPHKFYLSSGESFYDVKERITDFLNDLRRQFQSGNILIVTHGVVIKIVQALAQNNELAQLWKTPHVNGASLTIFKVDQMSESLHIKECNE